MKPTFQASLPARQRDSSHSSRPQLRGPRTDASFQVVTPAFGGGATSFRHRETKLHPAFHTLSESFFATEARKESRLEGALFAVIVALAAWPIVLAVQAATTLIK